MRGVQGLLGAFVDYIKERKTVALEDLAAEFGLRVQASLMYTACCNRQTCGLLTHLLACKQRFCHSAYTQEPQVKSAHEPVSEAEHTHICSTTCVNSGMYCCGQVCNMVSISVKGTEYEVCMSAAGCHYKGTGAR